MCYQLFHICKYCGKEYPCAVPNWICPTINCDENQNMCDSCELKEQEDYRKAYEEGKVPADKIISIEDWENK